MPADGELAALVVAARRGDQSAWDALVHRFAPLVWGVARGHGLNATAAADVAQTTWLRLVENLASVGHDDLGPWLASCTRAESAQALRWIDPRRDRRPARDPDAETLWVAVEGLPARSRLALRVLAVSPAPTDDEFAAALGCTVEAGRLFAADCLRRLSEKLPSATNQ